MDNSVTSVRLRRLWLKWSGVEQIQIKTRSILECFASVVFKPTSAVSHVARTKGGPWRRDMQLSPAALGAGIQIEQFFFQCR
jgi:hypothetical protein